MLNLKTLRNSLYTAIAPYATNTLIPEDSNAPAPSGEYLTYKLFSPAQNGLAELGEIDGNDLTPVTINWLISCRISDYRSESHEDLNSLAFNLFNNPVLRQDLIAAGLSPLGTPSINDIPAVIEGIFEERSTVTFKFHHQETQLIDSGVIEDIELEGTYKDCTGATILVTNTTISKP